MVTVNAIPKPGSCSNVIPAYYHFQSTTRNKHSEFTQL